MSKIVKAQFEGSELQFNSDGWFNATSAAAKFDKRPIDWLRLPETQRHIEALSEKHNVGKSHFAITKRGGKMGTAGTWLHPKLAVVFARWLSIEFALWCDEQIENIIHGKPENKQWQNLRHQAAASYKVMSALLEMKRQSEGKKTEAHHYANEAKLVNWVLTGEYSKLDRESLPIETLDLLAKLEEMNSIMIATGLDREHRKKRLSDLAVLSGHTIAIEHVAA